eukprot:403336198
MEQDKPRILPCPDEVKALTGPTETFLCSLKDNVYGIKFGAFKIRDMSSGTVLVDVREEDLDLNITEEMDDPKVRLVKYHFGPDFFMLRTIGLTVGFSIGDQPIPNFYMVERHYFRNKVIKQYEFKFGFCMPNSQNEIEMIYDLPELAEEEKQEMIENPWETKSDTFFFVNDSLVIHNRAEYNYSPLE